MLCNMKTNASLCALQTLVFIVDRCEGLPCDPCTFTDGWHSVNRLEEGHGESEDNILLKWYLKYRFDVVKGNVPLHVALVTTMADVLQQKNAEVTEITCKHSWFVFEMIIKSIAVFLDANGALSESVPRRTRLPAEFAHVRLSSLSYLAAKTNNYSANCTADGVCA